MEPDPVPFTTYPALIHFGCPSILGHYNIGRTIPVKITKGSTSLFTKNFNSTLRCWDRSKGTLPISPQNQPDPTIQPRGICGESEKVLTYKQIFSTVVIKICCTRIKSHGKLSFSRQRFRFKPILPV